MRKASFFLLNSLLLPFYVIAILAYMLPIVLTRGKVSGTAYEPFAARLFYDITGTRKDTAARRLAHGLPATNFLFRTLILSPLADISRVTGHVPDSLAYPASDPTKMTSLIAMRTGFLDSALHDFLGTADQFVILGAGWDTRAYGSAVSESVKVFEVDRSATQQIKRKALSIGGIDCDFVTFVECDFNAEDWLEKLERFGFDRRKKTFILWEGVSMYLTESAVARTLHKVSMLGAGSAIALDMFSTEWMRESKQGRASAKSVKFTYGEEFVFSIRLGSDPAAKLEEFVNQQGLVLSREHVQYLDDGNAVPFYAFVVASVS